VNLGLTERKEEHIGENYTKNIIFCVIYFLTNTVKEERMRQAVDVAPK
jgi:hypothetical protein